MVRRLEWQRGQGAPGVKWRRGVVQMWGGGVMDRQVVERLLLAGGTK
jgi:hypothetical protein